MGVLEETRNTLLELAKDESVPMEGVYYGMCRDRNLTVCNYFVFNRKQTKKASNKIDWQTTYQVNVVHEDCIPEGYVEKVIQTLESQENGAKLKATSDPVEYYYATKGDTDVVAEIAEITFYHPEKRGC